jgi:NADH dehydrogenase FAD-containing subunit
MHLERRLAGAPDVEVVLISKENFVLFTPMLHEVAESDVGALENNDPYRNGQHRTHDVRTQSLGARLGIDRLDRQRDEQKREQHGRASSETLTAV